METLRFLMVSSFYPPYHLGGDAVHVQYLAEALAQRGHEVHVEFSPAAYRVKRPSGSVPKTVGDARIRTHPVPGRLGPTGPVAAYLWGASHAATRFHARLLHELRPDVVHLHNISLLGLGVQTAPRGRPLLYTAHDYWFRCPRSDLLKNGRAPCERPACLACLVRSRKVPPLWRGADIGTRFDRIDRVIAPSRFLTDLAQSSFGCPVVHLPNFSPDGNPGGRVEAPSPYVLYVGVLEPHKGIRELMEAARRGPAGQRFVLVGHGSLERPLRALAERDPSRFEVRTGVPPEELSSLFAHAAALLMPSVWYENAPLAAIEALSWGCPVLGTSRGGVPELVRDGAAGLVFEPTAEGIRGALTALDGQADPMALRHGARRAYEAHHRPDAYLERYLALIRSLGGEPPRTPTAEPPEPGRPDIPGPQLVVPHGRHDP